MRVDALNRRPSRVCGALLLSATMGGCGPPVDITQALEITSVTTGWFDAGILEDGKNKLVPTISFQLENVAASDIRTVQINGIFRRVDEEEEWSNAFVRAIGGEGLPPGSFTPAIVLRSHLGYTGTQPRLEMLQHRQFLDAKVELFAKHGGAQWTKLGEFLIDRQLLTR